MTAEQLDLALENRADTADRGEIPATISEQRLVCPGDTLTTRQAQCLRGIEYAIANTGRAPTRRELCAMLGITSQRRLRELLDALGRKGFVRVDDGVTSGIAVLVPSDIAEIDDSRAPVAARPGLAKAKPRAAVARKAVG